MGVIKSSHVPATVTIFSLADIEKHAKQIILRARQQADQILLTARREGEALKGDAYVRGFEKGGEEGVARGLEEGRRAGTEAALNEHREQLTKLIAALAAAAGELESRRRELESNAIGDVIELAIAIADRVTKRQGLLDPQVATANVGEALKLVAHASDVRVAVHPLQKATLLDALPKLKMQWPALRHIEIVEDPGLAPGGCRVYSDNGQIDADLDGQLARIAADLVPPLVEIPT